MWGELAAKKQLDERDVERKRTFDAIPRLSDLEPVDFILSAEPTYTAIGKVIRDEIISTNRRHPYTALATAHAYALDRNVLYNRLLIDALVAGKYVVQDRGFVTSMVYQSVQGQQEGLALDDILSLPGNALAQQHMPGLLIILSIDPEVARKRGDGRAKKDDAIFEKDDFQRRIAEVYSSDWLREFFEQRGTTVAYLDMGKLPTPADTARKTVEVWENYLKSKKLI
jgi:thymidylate kinase